MDHLSSIQALDELRYRASREVDPKRACARVCMTGCRAYGAAEVRKALEEEVGARGLSKKVELRATGCQGFCARAPVLSIDPYGYFYQAVPPADVGLIVARTLLKGEILSHLLFEDPQTGIKTPYGEQVPFYKGQTRRVLENCGKVDPTNISHYLVRNGYAGLQKALALSPDEVIERVEKAGLRGRGGAGFPTGRKWSLARQAADRPKYMVCNADEGDPGAFMDRAVLEGDPHSVLEGMLIGAFAIGAEYGYIYVREEYPIAVDHLRVAIQQARELGLLGENILGTGMNFHLELKMGAGAFVCGEETALMASIEGRRGMPRPRPPFPAQAGIDGKPTNINNVETFANIRSLILNGSEWYANLGTKESKGTKIFSLAGKVNNTGLEELSW